MSVVSVRYFAALREAAGLEHEEVETSAESLAGLFRECARKHPGLSAVPLALVAVNDEMTQLENSFSDGDEILFFPPVAGG